MMHSYFSSALAGCMSRVKRKTPKVRPMRARHLIFGLSAVFMLAAGPVHAGYPCKGKPDTQYGLDDHFFSKAWTCSSEEIDEMWHRFDFDKTDWNEGFGFHSRCFNSLPLKRTFNALQVLKYAAGRWHCDTQHANILEWAYCWAGRQIDELDARCGDGRYAAKNVNGWDDRTFLYWGFFNNFSVLNRAGLLVHEARHAQAGCPHVTCTKGGECDLNYFQGCRGSMGAYAIQVHWLAHYVWHAVDKWKDEFRQNRAIGHANAILGSQFVQDPCFRMSRPSGRIISVCDQASAAAQPLNAALADDLSESSP